MRDEVGCGVEYDDEDFSNGKEGIPEMLVILLGAVRRCQCGRRKYFSNEQKQGDYREDIISISQP